MNVDAECRAAVERLHRSIGQKARWAHHDLAQMAKAMRETLGAPEPWTWIELKRASPKHLD